MSIKAHPLSPPLAKFITILTYKAMAFRINGFVLLQVLYLSALLIIPLSSGIVNEGFKDGMDPMNLLHRNGVEIISRKLRRLDATMQDYEVPGSNRKHDPKLRAGIGRNP